MFYVKKFVYEDCTVCDGRGSWRGKTRSGNRKTVECQECNGHGQKFVREEYREATIEERIEKLEERVEQLINALEGKE